MSKIPPKCIEDSLQSNSPLAPNKATGSTNGHTITIQTKDTLKELHPQGIAIDTAVPTKQMETEGVTVGPHPSDTSSEIVGTLAEKALKTTPQENLNGGIGDFPQMQGIILPEISDEYRLDKNTGKVNDALDGFFSEPKFADLLSKIEMKLDGFVTTS